ncbi:short chain dehydrogenase [Shewanella colwelliana]|uniref:SDR family oxidoreductase n=1 Tax=Shewanella colwelliana TaxID=23 RepID=UPI001BBA3E00|nr:SDR family oxidoreductase [Shewanella colwelliana]GIU20483.1 short chain dehydrogenase [Shewanella colwelliana]
MQELKDKVVIVTGASEGIGRALVKALAPIGCKLVLTARNQQRLDSLAQAISSNSSHQPLVFAADITDPLACQALISATVEHFGQLDILINNAGMTMWSRFDELYDLSILNKVMQVNYLAPTYLTHSALPHLKVTQGQIVVVASVAGLTGVPTRSGYSASKHAVMGFFDSLRIELSDDNVAVTILCPDFVVSEIHKRALDGQGNSLGKSPMQENKIITAAQCAQMMLPAIAGRKRLMITSLRGRLGRFVRLIAPGLIDKIARKAIASGH